MVSGLDRRLGESAAGQAFRMLDHVLLVEKRSPN